MGSKLDCQKPSHYLSENIFVDTSLTTKIVSQNHLKIEHRRVRNTCYGCQNVRTRLYLQRVTPEEISVIISVTVIRRFYEHSRCIYGAICDLDNVQVLEPIS